MADNIILNTGSGGSVLAADDISNVFYQRVKLQASAADSTEELSKAEDTAHSDGDSGLMALAVRRDANTTLVGTDGDYAPFQVDADGKLKVEIFDGGDSLTVDNAGLTDLAAAINANEMDVNIKTSITQTVASGATFTVQEDGGALTALQLIDDTVFVDDTATHSTGTTKLIGVGVVATPTDGSVGANDIGMLAMSTDRRLHVDSQIVGTDAALDVSAATVTVDLAGNNDVTIDASSVVYAEDVGHQAADAGLAVWMIRDDALAANAGVNADLDYMPFRANNFGALWVQPTVGNVGGCDFFNDIDLDEADIDVATGPCTVYGIIAFNETAAPLYLKMFNTNTVTMGTTNADLSLPIPANADSDGAGFVIPIPVSGVAFGTALTVAVTTGLALDDNTAPGANDANVTIFFQD